MKRLTVSVDDDLAALANAEVAAGRAQSVSAWVADAMRRKALGRGELIAELDTMRAESPVTTATLDWLADALGRSPEWVSEAMARSTSQQVADAG
ncbi:MAG: hypothetical protein ACT4PP_12270 [Sporichthyaceae bacterium]